MELKRIAAPTLELIPIRDAGSYLGLGTDTSSDDVIETLLDAAREDVEDFLRRPLLPQTWRITVDRREIRRSKFEDEHGTIYDFALPLPLVNVTSISAVRVYDTAGDAATIDPSEYALDGLSEDVTAYLSTRTFPTDLRKTQCLELEVVAGYASAAVVPAKFRRLVLALVAYDFEHRGDDQDRESRQQVQDGRIAVLQSGSQDRVIRI